MKYFDQTFWHMTLGFILLVLVGLGLTLALDSLGV